MSHVHLLLHFLTWGSAEYLYAVCGGETNPAPGDLNNLHRGLQPHWQVEWDVQIKWGYYLVSLCSHEERAARG